MPNLFAECPYSRVGSVLDNAIISLRSRGGLTLWGPLRVIARLPLARRRAFGRIATDLRSELDKVGEHVGLAAQLVGDHRRLARDGGDDGDPNPAALYRLD